MSEKEELKQYGWLTSKIYSIILLFYKNTFVIDCFKEWVDQSKEILDIGSGTGKDYKELYKHYKIIGSDYSDW